MAFDDVTLFEMHFDGANFRSPFGGREDEVAITDPDRMAPDAAEEVSVTDPDRMAPEAESESRTPSRRGGVVGLVALAGVAVAARTMYRRRATSEADALTDAEDGSEVAVESVDRDEPATEHVAE
jgi:hypothetical protein